MGRKPDIPAAKKEPGALNRGRWRNYREISRLEGVSVIRDSIYTRGK